MPISGVANVNKIKSDAISARMKILNFGVLQMIFSDVKSRDSYT